MANVLKNEDRAKNITVIFGITIVVLFGVLISDFLQYNLLSSYNISYSDAMSNDRRQLYVSMALVITLILNAVFFIMWFRRAYHNLQRAGIKIDYSEGWAAGCWFVPILNLFRPYAIMKEIRLKMHNYILQNGDGSTEESFEGNHNSNDTQIIGWWWASYIIPGFIVTVSNNMTTNARTIGDLHDGTGVKLGADIIYIISAFIAIKLIRDLSKQEGLFYNAWINSGESKGRDIGDDQEILDL